MDGRLATAAALAGFSPPTPVPVLALGKAACAMLAGAGDALGSRVGDALAITRRDAVRPGEPGIPGARVLFGDHPVPGPASLAAGAEAMAFCDAVPPGGELLALVSGGASALVEHLPPGMVAGDLARANRWLLASGLPIGEVNAVRGAMSMVKAGRLGARLAGRRVRVLALSDVPGDDPAVIGSGPFTPGAPRPMPAGLPGWLAELAAAAPAPSREGGQVDYRVVASGRDAALAAAAAARAAGVPAHVHEPWLSGTTGEAARRVVATLRTGPPGLHAWWGETTVRLPAGPGRGGRNRHLALALAIELAGRNGITVLCAATDGSDGDADAAGGWADGGTVARGRAAGLGPDDCLARADAGTFLAAAGDALAAGPTGTNVMDLVLALRHGGATAA